MIFKVINYILIEYDNGDKCLVYLSGDSRTANIMLPSGKSRRGVCTEEEYNQAEDCE